MEWDDLRFLLELARTKTLTGAARRLGVRHTTVARRIKHLEASLGTPLFDHSFDGYMLTERGKQLVTASEQMDRAFTSASILASESMGNSVETVRVGCVEGYGVTLLPRHLVKFQETHPQTNIDLLTVPRPIQLPKNEADIVITIDRPRPGPYVITKLADYSLRLFGSIEYLKSAPSLRHMDSLSEHRLITYIHEIAVAKSLPHLEGMLDRRDASLRSTSVISQVEAVRAGAGLAILPYYIGSRYDDLSTVLRDQVHFTRTYWMIMPAELKGIRKVRAVWEHLLNSAKAESLIDRD